MNAEVIELTNQSNAASNINRAQSPFNLLIKPIGPVCNLDCDYCYYLDKEKLYPPRHSFRMTDETLKSLTRQYIEAQPDGVPTVNFAWQGGEATLMGIEFFRRAMQYQQQFARPGMTITNALQTNGTLLDDEWGAFLKQHSFLVGISVDGPMKLHDRLRKTKTGEGSFNQVKRGIEVLKRFGIEHNFLCVINRQNGEHPQKVYKALKQLGAEHIQFIPIVEHNSLESRKSKKPLKIKVSGNSVLPAQFGKFLTGVFNEWYQNDVRKVFVQNFEEVIAKVMGSPSSLCVHAPVCGRNLAVEHDGSVFSCDHFVYPQFKLGNLMQTPLNQLVDGHKQMGFGQDKKSLLCTDCKACPYLQLCHGGCPAHRINRVQGEDKHLNYLCEGYKLFYKHTGNGMVEIARGLQNRIY